MRLRQLLGRLSIRSPLELQSARLGSAPVARPLSSQAPRGSSSGGLVHCAQGGLGVGAGVRWREADCGANLHVLVQRVIQQTARVLDPPVSVSVTSRACASRRSELMSSMRSLSLVWSPQNHLSNRAHSLQMILVSSRKYRPPWPSPACGRRAATAALGPAHPSVSRTRSARRRPELLAYRDPEPDLQAVPGLVNPRPARHLRRFRRGILPLLRVRRALGIAEQLTASRTEVGLDGRTAHASVLADQAVIAKVSESSRSSFCSFSPAEGPDSAIS